MQDQIRAILDQTAVIFQHLVVDVKINGKSYAGFRHGHDSPISRTLFGANASLEESVLINGSIVDFDPSYIETIDIGADRFSVDGYSWLGGDGCILKVRLGSLLVR